MSRLLIVVDYQVDFVDGALGFAGAEKLAQPIANKISEYRKRGDDVVFTFDTHGSDYLSTQEGRNLPVEHCIENTPGHKLYGAVASELLDSDKVFFKPVFGSVELFDWLRSAQRAADEAGALPFEEIELVGLVSNICVVANAVLVKTACSDVPVTVDAACTGSFDARLNEAALDTMESLQIKVANR